MDDGEKQSAFDTSLGDAEAARVDAAAGTARDADGIGPLEAAEEARLDSEAEAAYAAGRFVPHERVRDWLMRLAEGEDVAPPTA